MKLSKMKTRGFAATRLKMGLSQQQLAQKLGISKSAIGMAETGRRNLPFMALLMLAEMEIKMTATTEPGTVMTAEETNMSQS